MNAVKRLVIFSLDEQRYALPLSAVTRVVRAVEITSLPNTPEIIRGIINVQGSLIPVADIRKRFGLPAKELEPADHLIIAKTSRRPLALIADAVEDVCEESRQQPVPMAEIAAGGDYIEGVLKLEGGLVLIHDLDKFLSLEEDEELDTALRKT